MILRDYQINAFNEARYKISVEKKKRLIIHSGTGTGKTVIGAEITRSSVALGNRVLWLAHRKELINQGYRKLLENGIESNVVMASDSRRRPWLPVSIASVATLVKRKIKPVAQLIIIDECVSGDTLVSTGAGMLPIWSLGTGKHNALSWSLISGAWEYKKIIRWMPKGNRKTLSLKTGTGCVRCTPEHLFMTRDGWRRADSIQVGTDILIPLQIQISSESEKKPRVVPVDAVGQYGLRQSLRRAALDSQYCIGRTIGTLAAIIQNSQVIRLTALNMRSFRRMIPDPSFKERLHFVNVGAREDFRYHNLSSITKPASIQQEMDVSYIGKTAHSLTGMELDYRELKTEKKGCFLFPLRSMALYMEPFWGMLQYRARISLMGESGMSRHALQRIMDSPSTNGIFIRPANSHRWKLKSPRLGITGTVNGIVGRAAYRIVDSWRSFLSYVAIAPRSTSREIGLTGYLMKEWLGGTWTTDLFRSRNLVTDISTSIQKGILLKKIKSLWRGWNQKDLYLKSLHTCVKKQARNTTTLSSEPSIPSYGSRDSQNIQSHQWHTSFATLLGVEESGDCDVYDIEVEDNHNFVANGHLVHNCHRAPAASYLKILESYKDSVVLGLTATPCRTTNTSGLGDMFEDMVSCPSVGDMMERINPETGTAYLVPVIVYEPKRPDISGVGTGANGDYAAAGLSKIYGNPVIVGSIVDHWLKYGERRRTILFAAGIDDSKGFVARLKEKGVRAEHLDGTTPSELRDAILRRLESHETEVVSNVGVLTEGFDSPPTSCIILARPTKSVGLFLQMCGRALRPYPGKDSCIILDHAGCHQDHGDVDEDREWDLKSGVKRKPIPEDADMSAGMTTCQECARRYRAGPRKCPSCGYEREIVSRTIDEVDGELVRRVKEKPPEKPKSVKQAAHEERLKERYIELVKIAANTKKRDGTPYKPGFAAIQFHAETNWWPRKEWKEEALQYTAPSPISPD